MLARKERNGSTFADIRPKPSSRDNQWPDAKPACSGDRRWKKTKIERKKRNEGHNAASQPTRLHVDAHDTTLKTVPLVEGSAAVGSARVHTSVWTARTSACCPDSTLKTVPLAERPAAAARVRLSLYELHFGNEI